MEITPRVEGKNRSKVSVIVPVYNVENYLDRCMNSLLNQTLSDIEIIMVDDESPDNCPQMCDDYAKLDNRIKVIHKKNEGLGYARNSGIEIASGEFIAFVDSDDFIDLKMYEKLYYKAKELNLDTVLCKFSKVSNTEQIKPISYKTDYTIFENTNQINEVLLNMIGTEPNCLVDRIYEMSTCIAIYSKKTIDNFNIRFCSERDFASEDLLFQIDYFRRAKKIAITNEIMYFYCFNEASLTNTFRADRFDNIILLNQEIGNRLNHFIDKNRYVSRIDRFFIGDCRTLIFSISGYNMSRNQKIHHIRSICENPIWKEIYTRYPYRQLPIKYVFILICQKHKLINTLYLASISWRLLRKSQRSLIFNFFKSDDKW